MKKIVILMILLPLLVVMLYKVKSRLGINLINDGRHTPRVIQEKTGIPMGWVDTNWLRRK